MVDISTVTMVYKPSNITGGGTTLYVTNSLERYRFLPAIRRMCCWPSPEWMASLSSTWHLGMPRHDGGSWGLVFSVTEIFRLKQQKPGETTDQHRIVYGITCREKQFRSQVESALPKLRDIHRYSPIFWLDVPFVD